MEKTSKGIVLTMDIFWSDVGDWKSVWENLVKDKYGNATFGKVVVKNTKDCLVRAEEDL